MSEEQIIDKVSMIDQWKVSGDSYTQGELDAIGQLLELYYDNKKQLEQEKEKNKELEEKLKIAKQLYNDACVCIATDCVEKDKIKEMMKYREFELQQEYKVFEEDVEWRTYKKILEEK